MPDNPLARRAITITTVLVMFVALTLLSPLVLVVAFAIDVVRRVSTGKPWVTLRCIGFLWLYLLGELWAVAALLLTSVVPGKAKTEATIALQKRWVRWNVKSLTTLFDLEISVDGQEEAAEGPMILLVRHASLVDTLLPGLLIANEFDIRLRYVLKKELLADPALDIAGNRLPNYFIDRSANTAVELGGIRALGRNLGERDGVLIYPEGTRFSAAKRKLRVKRSRSGDPALAEIAAAMRMVLPPKPNGTLALLDESEADVVVLAHHGLEGLATVKDIWAGGLVGSEIEVKIWRIARDEIPADEADRKKWLSATWLDVDEWVVGASRNALTT